MGVGNLETLDSGPRTFGSQPTGRIAPPGVSALALVFNWVVVEDEFEVGVKARILVVEDSEAQGAHVVQDLEARGYEVRWARTGIEGLKLARQWLPELVVLDVVLGDVDGFSVCRWLKVHADTRDIPVIMLTVRAELEARVEGLQVGANDYLSKPFADDELEARIFAALRVRAAQSELKDRNRQLEAMLQHVESLAITDPLTGLFNRRRFGDVLRREFAVTKRYKNPLSCLMIDLDHFKVINDRFGHDAGDTVLREVAQRLGDSLREVDLTARYGGEEFAILLPLTDKPGAEIVAQRIVGFIRGMKLDIGGEYVKLTVSVGVACTTDSRSADEEELVRMADAALYEAKATGRDRVVVYHRDDQPGMD